jgi:hypothetical protein
MPSFTAASGPVPRLPRRCNVSRGVNCFFDSSASPEPAPRDAVVMRVAREKAVHAAREDELLPAAVDVPLCPPMCAPPDEDMPGRPLPALLLAAAQCPSTLGH